MRYEGFGGLIVLIADVWAIVNILQSGASTGNKVLWTVIVILLPILGFILWFSWGRGPGERERAFRRAGAPDRATSPPRSSCRAAPSRWW